MAKQCAKHAAVYFPLTLISNLFAENFHKSDYATVSAASRALQFIPAGFRWDLSVVHATARIRYGCLCR